MEKVQLEPNESVIMQSTDVLHKTGSFMENYSDELLLTNLNIILISKSMFGKTKSIQKYPLGHLKIINGEVQARLGKNSGGYSELQLYFIGGQEYFQFGSTGKKEIIEWINEISKVLTGHISSVSTEEGRKQTAIPGTEYLARTIKDTVGVFKDTFGIKPKNGSISGTVTKRCIGCMAPIVGTAGQRIRCSYCDTEQTL